MILQSSPGAGYLAHKKEIDEAISRVLAGGWYILGGEVEAFEKEWAAYLGIEHAIGVANGTDALILALRACGIGPGDGVVTVANTAVATVAAIELTGAHPVFVDIDAQDYLMNLDKLEEGLQSGAVEKYHIKAIIGVHLFGRALDMNRLALLARKYALVLIEDCAQAHGAMINPTQKTGTCGDISAFSFYPTKNLGALGDGGAVVTRNDALADKVRLLRQYGWRQRFISEIAGMNSRLDEIQAAILRVKLRYLNQATFSRQQIADSYWRGLCDLTELSLPPSDTDGRHVYHQYVVSLDHRDDLRNYLTDRKIGTAVLYPLPIHLQPAYQGRCKSLGALEATETAAQRLLALPIYPEMDQPSVDFVIKSMREFCERC
jgi:dTDP-4-amino-4,6-dideoxygalactose transaminase